MREVPIPQEVENDPSFLPQDRHPFDDFLRLVDENDERSDPTIEQREFMDRRIESLGELFADTDLHWQLDGAINISLLNETYIGVHKDVDISIERDELEELEKYLDTKGYGLYLSSGIKKDQAPMRRMQRVKSEKFLQSPAEDTMIAAFDEDGTIREDADLNFVDVHIIKRDNEGHSLGYVDTPLPDEWFKPVKYKFQDQDINLSHPALVAYHKLHQSRGYDRTDLATLVNLNVLTEQDADNLLRLNEEEVERSLDKGKDIAMEIVEHLEPGMEAEEVLQVMRESNESVDQAVDRQPDAFKQISKKISSLERIDVDAILETLIEGMNLQQVWQENRQRIETIHDLVIKLKANES